LDAISTNHPIFVWYTNGHDACVNSLALKRTNIPDNIGRFPAGTLRRDEKGQLNGLIYEESAMKRFCSPLSPKITPQLAVKAVSDYLRSVAAWAIRLSMNPERCVLTGLRLSQSFQPVGLPHERQPDV